jgi:hypothetical protein
MAISIKLYISVFRRNHFVFVISFWVLEVTIVYMVNHLGDTLINKLYLYEFETLCLLSPVERKFCLPGSSHTQLAVTRAIINSDCTFRWAIIIRRVICIPLSGMKIEDSRQEYVTGYSLIFGVQWMCLV